MTEKEPGAHELLVVGRVVRPHGVRGAVVVEVISDNPERFRPGERMLVERAPGCLEELVLESVAGQKTRKILRLVGVEDRDGAEALRDCDILIPASVAGALGQGEYWIHELVGLDVTGEDGRTIGKVKDVVSGTAQDLLEIETPDGGEFLVPFVEEFVKAVDPQAGMMTVRLIEGMGP